jgi:hypothetical protein
MWPAEISHTSRNGIGRDGVVASATVVIVPPVIDSVVPAAHNAMLTPRQVAAPRATPAILRGASGRLRID